MAIPGARYRRWIPAQMMPTLSLNISTTLDQGISRSTRLFIEIVITCMAYLFIFLLHFSKVHIVQVQETRRHVRPGVRFGRVWGRLHSSRNFRTFIIRLPLAGRSRLWQSFLLPKASTATSSDRWEISQPKSDQVIQLTVCQTIPYWFLYRASWKWKLVLALGQILVKMKVLEQLDSKFSSRDYPLIKPNGFLRRSVMFRAEEHYYRRLWKAS